MVFLSVRVRHQWQQNRQWELLILIELVELQPDTGAAICEILLNHQDPTEKNVKLTTCALWWCKTCYSGNNSLLHLLSFSIQFSFKVQKLVGHFSKQTRIYLCPGVGFGLKRVTHSGWSLQRKAESKAQRSVISRSGFPTVTSRNML